MAGCVIDEAIRNCVAVGADPERIALLDNFCWGNTERPETLGSLVLAAEACRDVALAYGTPFISGKDSLNNEYTHEGQSLAIPPTLLISAIGQVPDVRRCVTMDFKEPGNLLLLAGHDPARAGRIALGRRPPAGWRPRAPGRSGAGPTLVRGPARGDQRAAWSRSCHDLSEGGLAVALAEMALAGGLGATCRSPTFRATTTRPAISSCSSRNHPLGSCSKCLPSVWLTLAELFSRSAARPARRGDRELPATAAGLASAIDRATDWIGPVVIDARWPT